MIITAGRRVIPFAGFFIFYIFDRIVEKLKNKL
jgi:hypothetical protein